MRGLEMNLIYGRLTFGVVLLAVVLSCIYSFFYAGDAIQPRPDLILPSSEPIKLSDRVQEVEAENDSPNPADSESVLINESQAPIPQELYDDLDFVISLTRDFLVEKYNVQVTEQEIADFIEAELSGMIDESGFQIQRQFMLAQSKALGAMRDEGLSSSEAVDLYMAEYKQGGQADEALIEQLSFYAKQLTVEEFIRRIPEDLQQSVEMSVPGHREIVIDYKIAKILLEDDALSKKPFEWRTRYTRKLIEYAETHLSDVLLEFKNIDFRALKNL